jgi:DNA-directed RNA polymerase specialized sigma24 family protein
VPDEPAAARYYPAQNEHKRRVREARRRGEAVELLRFVQAAAGYAAGQLGNGLGPAQAREAALELAAELELAAVSLRRAVRLRPAERRALARLLAARGVPTRQIAARVGVSDRSVRSYVRGR